MMNNDNTITMNSMIQHPARTMATKNKNWRQETSHSYIKDQGWVFLTERTETHTIITRWRWFCNNLKLFLNQLARYGSKNCVLYLCCIESSKDFINGLKKCESSCSNIIVIKNKTSNRMDKKFTLRVFRGTELGISLCGKANWVPK